MYMNLPRIKPRKDPMKKSLMAQMEETSPEVFKQIEEDIFISNEGLSLTNPVTENFEKVKDGKFHF